MHFHAKLLRMRMTRRNVITSHVACIEYYPERPGPPLPTNHCELSLHVSRVELKHRFEPPGSARPDLPTIGTTVCRAGRLPRAERRSPRRRPGRAVAATCWRQPACDAAARAAVRARGSR